MIDSLSLILSAISWVLNPVFMRLDLYLKASRLVLRRTLAQEMCEAGVVQVNGTPAKSSRAINVGDQITLLRRNRLLSLKVLSVPASRQTSRSEATTLYQLTSDVEVADPFSEESGWI